MQVVFVHQDLTERVQILMTSVRNYKHGGKATEVNDMYEKQNDHGATMIDEKI